MNRLLVHICVFISFYSAAVKGQVSFNAILEQKEVSINELFSITFQLKIDAKAHEIENVLYPDFSDFNLVGSSNTTQSNLKNSIVSRSYTFRALKKGTFNIGQASIIVDGKMYKTQSLQIKIIGASKQTPPKKNNTLPRKGEVLTNHTSKDTKLLVTATNLSPYVGEQILISVRILSKDYNVFHRIRRSKVNRFKNFAAIDYPINRETIEEENYQGSVYYSRLIAQKIIVPQQVGKISLEPFQLEFPFLVKTDQRDFFGRPVNQYVWVKLDSNELVFDVKSLPTEGKPSSFSGAVGNFNLNVFSDKNNVNAGESIQFDIEVSGKGDFKMVTLPKLSLPDELEIYEPNTHESVTLTEEGHKGKISKSYVVVPQYKGKYEVPILEFSYFNPKTGKYETKVSEDRVLNVVKGSEKPMQHQMNSIAIAPRMDSLGQNEVLRPLKKTLVFHNPVLSESAIWFIILGALFFIPLVFGFLFLLRKQKEAYKVSKSKESSKKHLVDAKKYLKGNESLSFYNAIEKTLYHTLSKRLNIEASNHSLSELRILLQEQNVLEEQINQVEEILSTCSFQKYAPSNSSNSMETIYQKTIHFINTLKK